MVDDLNRGVVAHVRQLWGAHPIDSPSCAFNSVTVPLGTHVPIVRNNSRNVGSVMRDKECVAQDFSSGYPCVEIEVNHCG